MALADRDRPELPVDVYDERARDRSLHRPDVRNRTEAVDGERVSIR